jgi:hypothetical protein
MRHSRVGIPPNTRLRRNLPIKAITIHCRSHSFRAKKSVSRHERSTQQRKAIHVATIGTCLELGRVGARVLFRQHGVQFPDHVQPIVDEGEPLVDLKVLERCLVRRFEPATQEISKKTPLLDACARGPTKIVVSNNDHAFRTYRSSSQNSSGVSIKL